MGITKLMDYDNIYAVDTFEEEYKKMFSNSRDYDFYHKKLTTNLAMLDTFNNIQSAIINMNFEHIENTENLYSIRHVSTLNPRVIFFCKAGENTYILLNSFFERDKKDYRKAIKTAKSILSSLDI